MSPVRAGPAKPRVHYTSLWPMLGGVYMDLAYLRAVRLPGALTYIRQDEPGELSQWL